MSSSWLLVGNYGVGNLGDEALKEYFLEEFPEVSWKVVSAHPQRGEYPRLPSGIRSFLDPRWLKTVRALWNSQGIVFGGGSLFTDTESVSACFIWGVHALFARFLGKKVILAFQGIGPFHSTVGEWCARKVCRSAVHISVRDSLSAERVQKMNVNTKVVHTFDPVFSLIHNKNFDSRSQKILIAIPRSNSGKSFEEMLQNIIQKDVWERVHILSMQPSDKRERAYCQRLADRLGTSTHFIDVFSLSSLLEEVSKGSTVVTERFHGGIMALALEKELHVVSQKPGDKLSTLLSVEPNTILLEIEKGKQGLQDALVS